MSNTTDESKTPEPPAQEENKKPIAVREVRVVQDTGPLAYLYDTARFEHAYRIAKMMAMGSLLPEQLLGNKHGEFTLEQVTGNCFRIVMQAMRWDIDPFALLDESFVTGGRIHYQGKAVTAVINAKAGLKEPLKYTFSGEEGTDAFTISVSGTFLNGDEPRTVELNVGKAKTANDMWRKDPEQKLVYSASLRWARRHAPHVVLGIQTEDDAERREYWEKQRASKGEKPAFTVSNEEMEKQRQEENPQ